MPTVSAEATPGTTPPLSAKPTPNVDSITSKKSMIQHTHNFKWVVIQNVSKTQDGIEELKCSCGSVSERSIVPSSQVYINELYQIIDTALANEHILFASDKIYTISDYLIKKLQERADVTIAIIFEYDRKKYQIIIPANIDYTELLEDEDYFYGYFYFANKIGAKIEIIEE